MSNFMNEVYNCGIAPEFSVLMLKETIPLVWYMKLRNKKQDQQKNVCEIEI